jgi:hypothetical protein
LPFQSIAGFATNEEVSYRPFYIGIFEKQSKPIFKNNISLSMGTCKDLNLSGPSDGNALKIEFDFEIQSDELNTPIGFSAWYELITKKFIAVNKTIIAE